MDAATLSQLAKILEVGGMPGLSIAVVILAMKLYFGGPRSHAQDVDPTASALQSIATEMRNMRLELVEHRTAADTRLHEHDSRLGAIESRINSR